jgi:hypothetical protein
VTPRVANAIAAESRRVLLIVLVSSIGELSFLRLSWDRYKSPSHIA